MTMTTNSENLQKYKLRFYLIVDQILALASGLNMTREIKKLPPNSKTNYVTMVYVIEYSHLDSSVRFIDEP